MTMHVWLTLCVCVGKLLRRQNQGAVVRTWVAHINGMDVIDWHMETDMQTWRCAHMVLPVLSRVVDLPYIYIDRILVLV